MEFHGIPWNLECANFADTSSSMEFHGTWSAPISLTWEVTWNSMELWVRQFRWHELFHGIPWNLECANFDDMSSSMEFHGIPWNFCWSSMEFHGIPWNLINFIFKKIIFLNIVFGIWLMIRCYLAKISQKRYKLHWFQYRNSYFEHPSVSENGTRSAKMACCSLRYIDPWVKISYDILTPESINRGSKYRLTPARIHRIHDDVMKWNHFPRYWPFVRGIHAEVSCFLWSASEQTVTQTIETQVISGAFMTSL